jgi:hypothetical protein
VRLGVRGVGCRALQRGVQYHGAVQQLHPARPQQRAVPRSIWRNELQPAPLKSGKRGYNGEGKGHAPVGLPVRVATVDVVCVNDLFGCKLENAVQAAASAGRGIAWGG